MATVIAVIISGLLAAPGVRLAGLAKKTGQRPEAILAAFFLLSSVGALGRLIALDRGIDGDPLATALGGLGHVALTGCGAAVVVFTATVFRPGVAWARALGATLVVSMLATCALVLLPGNIGNEASTAAFLVSFSRLAPLTWLFAESLGQYRSMRLQRQIGLGDPIVMNRFGLWSIWTGALNAIPLIAIVARVMSASLHQTLSGAELEASQQAILGDVRLLVAALAIVLTSAVWLSFFPVERYLAWVRASDAHSALPRPGPETRV